MSKTYPVALVGLTMWKIRNITFRLGVMGPRYRRIVLMTDRDAEKDEIEEYDYQFVSSLSDKDLVARMTGDGCSYGIPRHDVETALENDIFPIVACDTDALESMRTIWPDTLAILIDENEDGADELRLHCFDIVFDNVLEHTIANAINMFLSSGGRDALDNPKQEFKKRLCETLCGIPLTRTMDEARRSPYICSTNEMYDLETSLGIDSRAGHMREMLAPNPIWGLNVALVSHDGDTWETLVVSGGVIVIRDHFKTQGCALAALASPVDANELHRIENRATEAQATTKSRMFALSHMDVLLNTTFSATCEELDLACVNAPKEGLTRISAFCGQPCAILRDTDDIRAVIATVAFTYDLWDMDVDARSLLTSKAKRTLRPHPIEVVPAHMVDASLINSILDKTKETDERIVTEVIESEEDAASDGKTAPDISEIQIVEKVSDEDDEGSASIGDEDLIDQNLVMTYEELLEAWDALLDDLRTQSVPGEMNEIYQSVPMSDDGKVITVAVPSKQKLITMRFHDNLWQLFESHFDGRDVSFVTPT